MVLCRPRYLLMRESLCPDCPPINLTGEFLFLFCPFCKIDGRAFVCAVKMLGGIFFYLVIFGRAFVRESFCPTLTRNAHFCLRIINILFLNTFHNSWNITARTKLLTLDRGKVLQKIVCKTFISLKVSKCFHCKLSTFY